jgi:HEAT repeat protein
MPYKPGESGNPSGRPKTDFRVKELAREYTEQAITALVDALADERTRVAAAIALLDRGYGKPAQALTGEDGGAIIQEVRHIHDLKGLSDSELETLAILSEKALSDENPHTAH